MELNRVEDLAREPMRISLKNILGLFEQLGVERLEITDVRTAPVYQIKPIKSAGCNPVGLQHGDSMDFKY